MKFKDIKSMANEELGEKMKQLRMELVKANAQVATGTVPKNSGQIRQSKKAIAKIKTLLNQAAEEKTK